MIVDVLQGSVQHMLGGEVLDNTSTEVRPLGDQVGLLSCSVVVSEMSLRKVLRDGG